MNPIDRRSFLATGAAAAAAASCAPLRAAPASQSQKTRSSTGQSSRPCVISSGNGKPAVDRAMALLSKGASPTDAVVEGVVLVENDPDDMSVGYGGLPNEHGIVQLDSSVMDGPMHKAGAVAALENIKNPSRVALRVLRETDHVLLVGEGALQFARALGFEETNLLTPKAREAWLKWKRNANPKDDWLDDAQRIQHSKRNDVSLLSGDIPFTWGTIHCAAVDANGDIGAVTTTSGLSYKLPGRVGDSPIVGAGMYVLNDVGAAGATGRGESVMQSCGAFQVVQHMANGDDPEHACLKVLKWIADHTKRHDLLNDTGQPNFEVTMYAVRKDGAFGSATMHGPRQFAVHDGTESQLLDCARLFE